MPFDSKADRAGEVTPLDVLMDTGDLFRQMMGSFLPESAQPASPSPQPVVQAPATLSPPAAAQGTLLDGLSDLMAQAQVPTLHGLLDNLNRFSTGQGFGVPRSAGLPEGARYLDLTFANAAGTRDYKLYVPSCYAGEPVPLIVMLHGCTQNPEDFAAGTRMNEFAERDVFLVAYPGQSTNANSGRCWNWFETSQQRRDAGEPSIVAGITEEIMRDYAVDPDRVFAAGLSAGGALAAILGSQYPDLYKAVAVHSGLACGSAGDLSSALSIMAQGASLPDSDTVVLPQGDIRPLVPTIVIHGDQDTTVHARNGERVVSDWLAGNRLDLAKTVEFREEAGRPHTRTRHCQPDGRVVLEQWTLHGFGHAWSGGSPAGSYTDPRGPDASAEILRFFLHDSRPKPEPRPDGSPEPLSYRDRFRARLAAGGASR